MEEKAMEFLQKLNTICLEKFLDESLVELETLLLKTGKPIGEGTSRRVISLNNDYVAKLPLSSPNGDISSSMICNLREYLVSKIPEIPVANTELYFYAGIPIIVMERLDTRWETCCKFQRPTDDEWDFSDCFQGGLSKKSGKLLSYDCGYERRLLEKFGSDFSPLEFEAFSVGNPSLTRYLKTLNIQQELALTP